MWITTTWDLNEFWFRSLWEQLLVSVETLIDNKLFLNASVWKKSGRNLLLDAFDNFGGGAWSWKLSIVCVCGATITLARGANFRCTSPLCGCCCHVKTGKKVLTAPRKRGYEDLSSMEGQDWTSRIGNNPGRCTKKNLYLLLLALIAIIKIIAWHLVFASR